MSQYERHNCCSEEYSKVMFGIKTATALFWRRARGHALSILTAACYACHHLLLRLIKRQTSPLTGEST